MSATTPAMYGAAAEVPPNTPYQARLFAVAAGSEAPGHASAEEVAEVIGGRVMTERPGE